MKNYYLILLLALISANLTAQNKIHFSYDEAGNQTVREWCPSCDAKKAKTPLKEIAELKEEDLQKFFPKDAISYYPNPVKEELYLKWDLTENNKVTSIQVYALSGQLVTSINKLENKNNEVMTFQNYPLGVYSVILVYANGDEKAIKIIKQ
jgi:Secretion system C-terminal sorting domain